MRWGEGEERGRGRGRGEGRERRKREGEGGEGEVQVVLGREEGGHGMKQKVRKEGAVTPPPSLQGQFRSTLKCLTCQNRSVMFEAFMYLSVPLPPGNSHCTLKVCHTHYNIVSTHSLIMWPHPLVSTLTDNLAIPTNTLATPPTSSLTNTLTTPTS